MRTTMIVVLVVMVGTGLLGVFLIWRLIATARS
jgi:hypothetical protein